jgi:hypothetical protein
MIAIFLLPKDIIPELYLKITDDNFINSSPYIPLPFIRGEGRL